MCVNAGPGHDTWGLERAEHVLLFSNVPCSFLSDNIGSLFRVGFGRAELGIPRKMAHLSIFALLIHPLSMPSWQQT